MTLLEQNEDHSIGRELALRFISACARGYRIGYERGNKIGYQQGHLKHILSLLSRGIFSRDQAVAEVEQLVIEQIVPRDLADEALKSLGA